MSAQVGTLGALAAIAREIAADDDLERALGLAIEIVGTALAADHATLFLAGKGDGSGVRYAWRRPGLPPLAEAVDPRALDLSACAERLARGDAVTIDGCARTDLRAAWGVAWIELVPLRSGARELSGVFALGTQERRERSDREEAVLAVLACAIENALCHARERSRQRDRDRRLVEVDGLADLATGVAHDLKNMLSLIRNSALLVGRLTRYDEPVLARVGDIELAVDRCADLAQKLAFCADATRAERCHIDVDAVVEESVRLVRADAPAGVTVATELGGARVEGDPTLLRQLVTNLLLNARDAVAATGGRIVATTRVVARREADAEPATTGDHVVLEVRDDGCGMTRDQIARAFDASFSTKGSGRGIGLAVVAAAVRAHEGTIDVESMPGHGALFRVALPLRQR